MLGGLGYLLRDSLKVICMTSDIVLIGPIGTGKSTIGALLADKLGLPQCSMDERRWDYYKEIGYDEEIVKKMQDAEDFWGVGRYWKRFEAHAVERLLADHHQCVIDFGAGHSVYEDETLFKRVERVLAPYSNVILLMPSFDLDESVQILKERNLGRPAVFYDINEHFVRHPSNYKLAKFTVYTKGKTPEETCNEILNLVDNGSINYSTSLSLEISGYSARCLVQEDAAVLQPLYEQCTEFALLTDGQPPSPTAASEEFDATPEGKTTQDKYIFGLFDPRNILVGMIESIRHYPDNKTWWIGLMMLAPKQRHQGLGSELYRAFERWVSVQGVSRISLSVVEANEAGLQFWKKMGFEVIRKTPPRQFGTKTHELYILSRAVDGVN